MSTATADTPQIATTRPPGAADAGKAAHQHRVATIAAAVREAASSAETAHIDKGGVHHVVPLATDRRFTSRSIDTSALTHVIELDPLGRTCVAEAGVTFEAILRVTLEHGLIPTVVPELRGITLGGAVAGCSVESMSFRHGGFHDSCLAYEVVDGTGTVRTLSRERDRALFDMVHGSYGTLGIVTAVTFELVPAKPFVEVTYRHFHRADEYRAAIVEACDLDRDDGPDFVDGIVHAPNHLTLCEGRFVDRPGTGASVYSTGAIYWRSTAERRRDVLSTEEYCFRYDSECHWMTATIPPLQWGWVRRLVGRHVLGSTNLIGWSNRLAPIIRHLRRRPEVVCDVFVPETRFGDFWAWYTRVFDFWPLWVVPYRARSQYPWLGPVPSETMRAGELCIDFAVYGKSNNEAGRDYSELLETETLALGGIKTLIGRNHFDRETFWRTYDWPAYAAARAKLDPHAVPRPVRQVGPRRLSHPPPAPLSPVLSRESRGVAATFARQNQRGSGAAGSTENAMVAGHRARPPSRLSIRKDQLTVSPFVTVTLPPAVWITTS
ncbi:MAG: FAD-binding oxidoreductase [Microthrixaceae bacterium]